MTEEPPRKRGRPARPTTNAMGQYLRSLREERGLTVRELARAVGLSDSSASYISQLEAGVKAPNPELAERLAEVLRDRQGVFRLWAMTSPRGNDPRTVASSQRELARVLGDPSIAPDSLFDDWRRTRIEEARESLMARRVEQRRVASELMPPVQERRAKLTAREILRLQESRSHQEWRIPLIEEHELDSLAFEPDAELALPRERGWLARLFLGERPTLRLDSDSAATLPPGEAFACRIGRRLSERVAGLLHDGDVVVFTLRVLPLVMEDLYLVRSQEQSRLLLSHVMHNGRELLLMPRPGHSDFEVLPARGEPELLRWLVAHVARVIRYPEPTFE